MIGLGLPTKYGSVPVDSVMSAATDPVAGSGPSLDGAVASGFVTINRAPALTNWTASVMVWNEYVRLSPRTTKSGSVSVSVYPTSCSAVFSPASPITYAEASGIWFARNCAVATAEVQIRSSGTAISTSERRAARSRRVYIELLVRTRNSRPCSRIRSMNASAPGRAASSRINTPSISINHVSGRGSGSVILVDTYQALPPAET